MSQLDAYLGSVEDNFGGRDADLGQRSARHAFQMVKKVWNSTIIGNITKLR